MITAAPVTEKSIFCFAFAEASHSTAFSRHQGVRGGGDDRVDLRGQLVSLDQDFDEVIINLPRRIEAAFEVTEQR